MKANLPRHTSATTFRLISASGEVLDTRESYLTAKPLTPYMVKSIIASMLPVDLNGCKVIVETIMIF